MIFSWGVLKEVFRKVMAFGWFLRRFCRSGDRASQWKEGLRKGWVHSGNCTTCFGSAVRGMKVGDRLTPGGLGLQVDTWENSTKWMLA